MRNLRNSGASLRSRSQPRRLLRIVTLALVRMHLLGKPHGGNERPCGDAIADTRVRRARARPLPLPYAPALTTVSLAPRAFERHGPREP